MQPKVSMVIPCYNKVQWIGNMFDSVIAQKWDNIELILVNDGSTDGTRSVIEDYLPKFHERGYDVIVIDQVNQGVPAAVKNGLIRMTGEYVCIPDCDDELHPDYVSSMAGWLWEHPGDQWVVCDSYRSNFNYSDREGSWRLPTVMYPYRMLESFFFARHLWGVWILMVRISYMEECRVLEAFQVKPRVIQEPQIWIPLALGGASPAYIQKPLYNYCVRNDSISQSKKTFADRAAYAEQRYLLAEKTFLALKEPDNYDNFLLEMGNISMHMYHLAFFEEYDDAAIAESLVSVISKYERGFDNVSNAIKNSGCYVALRYISDKLIGRESVKRKYIDRSNEGRIIAYPALSRAAKRIETGLLSSDIRPNVFWDIRAENGGNIGGIPICKPSFEELTSSDVVLVLLRNKTIIDDVMHHLEAAQAQCDMLYFNDILDYLVGFYYDG
jgi:glycosyltransferase involved in cell wall biosynthesis